MVEQYWMRLKNNVDTKTVVSTAIGAALFGGVVYLAKQTNVAPVKKAAKVAQGGGK